MSYRFKIVVFAGDNCGPEMMNEALKASTPNSFGPFVAETFVRAQAYHLKVLKTVENHHPAIKFDFEDHLLGGASIDATGSPLEEEAITAAKNADAVLLGAIGGPTH
ncbi:hypothetical protein B0O99DRAFT_672058 [Bisporella sp. PMI_857]|nr:hypothetical protein B0O99DRAFT_672058 [Bisporella sp. PMI_857]